MPVLDAGLNPTAMIKLRSQTHNAAPVWQSHSTSPLPFLLNCTASCDLLTPPLTLMIKQHRELVCGTFNCQTNSFIIPSLFCPECLEDSLISLSHAILRGLLRMCGSKFAIQTGSHLSNIRAAPSVLLFCLPECCEPCHLQGSCHKDTHLLNLYQFIFWSVCIVVDLLS